MTTSGPAEPLLIDLQGIGFAVARPVPTRILHPIDVTVTRGTSLAVVGPSGAGKTTLASIVGGLQDASEGSYLFDGTQIRGLTRSELARFRAENVGFVFQNAHLIDERAAWRNVALGIVDPGLRRAEIEERSRAALAAVGLGHVADREAALLSGGERQRVATARALVKEPRLVIADEPTGSLDQRTGLAILELLFSLTSTGTTLVLVSHDPRAATLADRCLTLVDGRIAA
jgi:ABC-type lipoprotein export system ATPase subunit